LYEVLALLGLGEEDGCREALSDWMRAMTDITNWETMREEFNAGRAGKTNFVFKFHTIVLDRMRMGVSVEYPPDVEERRSRGVDVRSCSMAYGYLDAILKLLPRWNKRSHAVYECPGVPARSRGAFVSSGRGLVADSNEG
jgi:hypothetical protein